MSSLPPENLASLIRSFRFRAGLTQEQLAERSGLSVRAISDLERSLRIAPRMETLRMLASALELDSEHRSSLFVAARPEILDPVTQGSSVADRPISVAPEFGNGRSALPIPPTHLIGREREASHLQTLFESPGIRLITLTGPGGVGKTRLAVDVAKAIALQTSVNVAFIDLTSINRPSMLAASITESLALPGALNRPPIDALCQALQDHSLLLLLDNFEHLLDAAPAVSTLLEACRNLRILVTSRERLQLRGEHVFPVSPLPLPNMEQPSGTTLASVGGSPAVRLFLDRAREARLDLKVDDRDALSIANICSRLEGLPLAIELAASRMRHESATTLLEHLDHRLPTLIGGARDLPNRQQTLRNTISWSYALLPVAQQSLFRALCVFPGGFTLEAAVSIAEQQSSALRQLSPSSIPDTQLSPFDTVISLMEHSFIRQSAGPDHAYRFAILDSVREFGLEVLAEHGEVFAAEHRLLSWFVSQTGALHLEALDGYVGTGPFALTHDEDNMRTALAVSIAHGELSSAVRIALKLSPLWWAHGLYAEARTALDRIISHADDLEPVLLGTVLGWAAEWAWLQSDYLRTRELANAALTICRTVDHEAGAAANLYRLGRVATALKPLEAQPILQEALEINRRLGNYREAAWTLLGSGYAAVNLNELAAAESYFEQANALIETLEDPLRGGLSVSCAQARAWFAFQSGNVELAKTMLEQTLVDCRQQTYEFGECNALRLLGRVARERGDLDNSASLYLAAMRLSQHQGVLRRECYCLVELASIAQANGQPTRTARLLGAEASLRRQLGHVYTPDEMATQSRSRDAALQALGESDFTRAWQSGESLGSDARLAEAALVQSDAGNHHQHTPG